MLCGSLDGRGVWERMDTCICMAESLSCSPETTTTLLIGYTPVQNKTFKAWEKKNSQFETMKKKPKPTLLCQEQGLCCFQYYKLPKSYYALRVTVIRHLHRPSHFLINFIVWVVSLFQ